MLKLALKALWDGSFTFSLLPITSHIEKVFPKKLGFCCIKRTQFLILDKVELRGCLKKAKNIPKTPLPSLFPKQREALKPNSYMGMGVGCVETNSSSISTVTPGSGTVVSIERGETGVSRKLG